MTTQWEINLIPGLFRRACGGDEEAAIWLKEIEAEIGKEAVKQAILNTHE
ncbi:hypothetical protein [aff. Roholtiella sp. LEGE 12411]|nr:hypothetical protein [aff. Roholtiella sp. LEGE 12411]MBE9036038.1 hypothetical protein [aff. Roholtiella sp. LEGE 12411]